MTNEFQLPGAERFSQFLEDRVEGTLTAEGPEVVDYSYNGKYAQKWIVRLNGKQIGEYLTFGPKPGETAVCREFRGRIPGYMNECVQIHNAHSSEREQLPLDTVSLIWSNKTWITGEFSEGEIGRFEETPWQRQDGHTGIAFP